MISLTELDQKYREHCERLEDRKGYENERYETDAAYARQEVGDFLDWLEEELTGKRPQPDTTVRYYRKP